jgi:hypothetical protein
VNLEQVFKSIGEKPKAKKCEATVGLLEEGDEIAAEFKGSPAINAALIAAGQKVEHYEIASYGCLVEWAGLLGNQKAADLLRRTSTRKRQPTKHSLKSRARATTKKPAMESRRLNLMETQKPQRDKRSFHRQAPATGGQPSLIKFSKRRQIYARSIQSKNTAGKVGWVLLWALGIPIPILLILFLLRGCT